MIFAQRPRLVRGDQNTLQLEITFFSPALSFTHLYRFTGAGLHLVASTEDLPSEPPRSAALRILFDEQDPAGALTLLTATPDVLPATATPADPDPALRRALTYAQALAHEYLGQDTRAAALYRRLAEEPRSPWAPRARQRLDHLCAQRTC
ncbi:MAG: hypothetical protein Q9O62_14790 [Ardenticatenia bacterium]|nr:hypothetical protein [Ardenticatenia bacterium]